MQQKYLAPSAAILTSYPSKNLLHLTKPEAFFCALRDKWHLAWPSAAIYAGHYGYYCPSDRMKFVTI